MMGDAHKVLLDRERITTAIERTYQEPLSLLHYLTDYGSELIFRAYDSSSQHITDTILLFSFLKQSVLNLDAIAVLVAQGCVDAGIYPLRSLVEQSFYIEWFLSGETQQKISHFYVAHLRKMQAAHIPDLPEGMSFPPEILRYGQQRTDTVNEIVTHPDLDPINQAFEHFYQKRKYEPSWLQIYGIRSLKGIAKAIHKEEIYTVFYSDYSEFSHSQSLWRHFQSSERGIEIEPIRQIKRLPTVVYYAALFALTLYRQILLVYCPGDLDSFIDIYHHQWKPTLDRIASTTEMDLRLAAYMHDLDRRY